MGSRMGENSIEIENDVFLCTRTDDVAFLSFKQNPIEVLSDSDIMNAFFSTFSKIDDSRKIKGLVITNWSEYTGGIYLKGVISHIVETLKHERQSIAIQRLKNSLDQLVNRFINFTKPTITAFNGNIGEVLFAMGLVCDFRYATPNTIIHLPTVKFGLPTTGVLPFYLAHHIGAARSIEILMSKTSLDANEVNDLGLLTDLVPDEEMITRCITKLNDISQYPSYGIASMKRILRPDANEISKFMDRAFEEFILNINEIKESLSNGS